MSEHNASQVSKHSAGTRSYSTKGAACAIARKSLPVNEPAYLTRVLPANGGIPSPLTSREDRRVVRRAFWELFIRLMASRQKYLTNPKRMTCRISTGVSWWASKPAYVSVKLFGYGEVVRFTFDSHDRADCLHWVRWQGLQHLIEICLLLRLGSTQGPSKCEYTVSEHFLKSILDAGVGLRLSDSCFAADY